MRRDDIGSRGVLALAATIVIGQFACSTQQQATPRVAAPNAMSAQGWIDAEHTVEELAPPHAFLEAVAFGLRDMLAGVDLSSVGQAAAPARHAVERELERHDGLAEKRAERWHLTPRGARFADRLARAVLAVDVTRR